MREPWLAAGSFLSAELLRLRRDRSNLSICLIHFLLTAIVLWWTAVCGITTWLYILCFVYPGLTLTLLCSYTEHRPGPSFGQRSAIVESRIGTLLYLSVSLHHLAPSLPWYTVANARRKHGNALREAHGGFFFRGYRELFRRYAPAAKNSPLHPGSSKSN